MVCFAFYFLSFLFLLLLLFLLLKLWCQSYFFFAKCIITWHDCTLKNSLSMTVTWIIVQVVYLTGNPRHFSPRWIPTAGHSGKDYNTAVGTRCNTGSALTIYILVQGWAWNVWLHKVMQFKKMNKIYYREVIF